MNYGKHYQTRQTPQSQPVPGSNQVPNSAGGYAFPLDDWKRLERFLILGCEGGTYYSTEQKLTVQNADTALRLIAQDGLRVVKTVVEVSERGRAPKNDPALFVLAMAASKGSQEVKRAALDALPKVARIGTHLFHFAEFVQGFRGWGRSLRRGIAGWYNGKPADKLAMQLVKYQQRDGWSHRDLIQLAHPKAPSEAHNALYKWAVDGKSVPFSHNETKLIVSFYEAHHEEMAKATAHDRGEFVVNSGLPREALPTEWLKEPEVWDGLLPGMGLTALIRNLGNLGKVGLLTARNPVRIKEICDRLMREEDIRGSRVHPVQILATLMTYKQGHGMRGKGEWEVVPKVVDALDSAFYLAFQNVEPTDQKYLLGMDVSPSMNGGEIAGVPGLTPRMGASALAMLTVQREENVVSMAFSGEFVPFPLSRKQRLDDVMEAANRFEYSWTNCSLPILYAMKHKIPVDVFVVLTDSETWAGNIHPTQALQKYREQFNPKAKLIVVGMTSNGFSIADPNDAGMLDVVGFDTAVPEVMRQFAVSGA